MRPDQNQFHRRATDLRNGGFAFGHRNRTTVIGHFNCAGQHDQLGLPLRADFNLPVGSTNRHGGRRSLHDQPGLRLTAARGQGLGPCLAPRAPGIELNHGRRFGVFGGFDLQLAVLVKPDLGAVCHQQAHLAVGLGTHKRARAGLLVDRSRSPVRIGGGAAVPASDQKCDFGVRRRSQGSLSHQHGRQNENAQAGRAMTAPKALQARMETESRVHGHDKAHQVGFTNRQMCIVIQLAVSPH